MFLKDKDKDAKWSFGFAVWVYIEQPILAFDVASTPHIL